MASLELKSKTLVEFYLQLLRTSYPKLFVNGGSWRLWKSTKKDKCIEREKRTKVIGANAILEASQCSLRRQMSVRNWQQYRNKHSVQSLANTNCRSRSHLGLSEAEHGHQGNWKKINDRGSWWVRKQNRKKKLY